MKRIQTVREGAARKQYLEDCLRLGKADALILAHDSQFKSLDQLKLSIAEELAHKRP